MKENNGGEKSLKFNIHVFKTPPEYKKVKSIMKNIVIYLFWTCVYVCMCDHLCTKACVWRQRTTITMPRSHLPLSVTWVLGIELWSSDWIYIFIISWIISWAIYIFPVQKRNLCKLNTVWDFICMINLK